MRSRFPWPLRLSLLALAIAGGILAALLTHRPQAPVVVSEALPELGDVAPFALTDATGAPLDLEALRGRVWTANLFFTTCPSICPPLMHNLSSLQKDLGPAASFDLLSISVDPETDTPPVLAAYATSISADTGRWHFATGSTDAIRAFATDGLHLSPGDEPIGHSPYVVLVDRNARIRGYYDGLDAEALRRLAGDLPKVIAE